MESNKQREMKMMPLNNPPTISMQRSSSSSSSTGPPLSAINRFLWGQHLSALTWHNVDHDIEGSNLIQGFLANNNNNEVHHHMMISTVLKNKQVHAGKRINKKGSSSASLIKGQWTDEEDRKLVKLVNEYGVRKWAQIAENLEGRAGKQCRERWHNHLRPHIKKDSWSEEEEKVLVETHAKVGNRWAEIAKKIPGRTENSIKNHWNATKRRQNSKRNLNKSSNKHSNNNNGRKPPSSILQDYIKSIKTLSNNNNDQLQGPPDGNQFNLVVSDHHHHLQEDLSHCEPVMSETFDDDELLFMQKFFPVNYDQNQQVHSTLDFYQTSGGHEGYPPEQSVSANFAAPMVKQQPHHHHHHPHHSDLFLDQLLNGIGYNNNNPSIFCYDYYGKDQNLNMGLQVEDGDQQAWCEGKRDMDLMELVSSQISTSTN